jgi:hypothetical protein
MVELLQRGKPWPLDLRRDFIRGKKVGDSFCAPNGKAMSADGIFG